MTGTCDPLAHQGASNSSVVRASRVQTPSGTRIFSEFVSRCIYISYHVVSFLCSQGCSQYLIAFFLNYLACVGNVSLTFSRRGERASEQENERIWAAVERGCPLFLHPHLQFPSPRVLLKITLATQAISYLERFHSANISLKHD